MTRRAPFLRYSQAGAIGATVGIGLAAIWTGGITLVAQGSIASGDEAMSIAAVVMVLGFPCNVLLALLHEAVSGRSGLDAITGGWAWLAIALQWGGFGMLVRWAAGYLWRRSVSAAR